MSEEKDPYYSIVEYMNEHSGYRCGYCKSPDTNFSHGMWAHRMSVTDYQALINRGWRRSGKYCYKPTMNKICCPHYTIKCDALNFKISKSQKKVLKRMHNFLSYGTSCKEVPDDKASHVEDASEEKEFAQIHPKLKIDCLQQTHNKIIDDRQCESMDVSTTSASISLAKSTLPLNKGYIQGNTAMDEDSAKIQSKIVNYRPGSGPDPSRPPCKKAKLVRREKRDSRLSSANNLPHSSCPKNVPKTLEDLLNEPLPANPAHRLEVKLVRPDPLYSDFKATVDISHSVYEKYQMNIHLDPKEKVGKSKYKRFLVDSPLQLRLVRESEVNGNFKKTYKKSYGVFRNYQMTIHKESEDECEESSFNGFLVDSPLVNWKPLIGPACGYGSFHQQYWLDDELIAVGVIDILPDCVSSVYLYYDPTYSFLSLGTYSSLREISLVKELNRSAKNIKWYYMGYYIHSCVKMRYKGKYNPSVILCPETYSWVPIEKCIPKLDVSKYSKLNNDIESTSEDEVDYRKVICLYQGKPVTYENYLLLKLKKEGRLTFEDDIEEYCGLAGTSLAYSLMLCRS